MSTASEQDSDSAIESERANSKPETGNHQEECSNVKSDTTVMSTSERESIIAMAEADLLPDISKVCVSCDGDKCNDCNNTGFEMARKAKQLGGLTYSQGYQVQDIYQKLLAKYHGDERYKEGYDAVVDALADLEKQPCPPCNGTGKVEYLLSPVQGGGLAERECPACKSTGGMKQTSEASREMHRTGKIKSIRKDKAVVLAEYADLRLAKGGDPKAST